MACEQRRPLERQTTIVLCALVLVCGVPRVTWGACPAPGSICGAYDRADLVFVGDVVSVQPEKGPRAGGLTHVRFQIIQRFKGSLGDEVVLSLSPSSEEFDYTRARRVLVYARRSGRVWSTACTRTRQVAATDTEPVALRALQEKQHGGIIDGTVATPEMLRAGRALGIRVVVERDGAIANEILTDVAGRFQTGWLAPGRYVLSVQGENAALQGRREVVLAGDSDCISVGSIVNR
jgi:hypothetical protein